MNTFHDLFRQATQRVGDTFPPDRRGELFPGFVARSRKLHLWLPEQRLPDKGEVLIIGVATWSGYDLNLLDLIEESPDNAVRIEVLDVDAGSPPQYPKGLPTGTHTPFVGHWVDGKLVGTACGFEGRALIAHVCGLSAEAVSIRISSILKRL